MIWPAESRTSHSMSSSSGGRVDWVSSLKEGEVGARSVVAPRTMAPSAR